MHISNSDLAELIKDWLSFTSPKEWTAKLRRFIGIFGIQPEHAGTRVSRIKSKVAEIIEHRLSNLLLEAAGEKISPPMEIEIFARVYPKGWVSRGTFTLKSISFQGMITSYRGETRSQTFPIYSPTLIKLALEVNIDFNSIAYQKP